jgi:hypothetical protein
MAGDLIVDDEELARHGDDNVALAVLCLRVPGLKKVGATA